MERRGKKRLAIIFQVGLEESFTAQGVGAHATNFSVHAKKENK